MATPGKAQTMLEIELKSAWQKKDPRFEQDAIEYWTEHGLVADEELEKRSRQLSAVAYHGDKLVGITTATLVDYKMLGHRLAFHRVSAHHDYRRNQVMNRVATKAIDVLQQWSLENPQKRIAGICTHYDAPYLRAGNRPPVSEIHRFFLCGYTDSGRQVRVRWFDHTRV